MIQRSEQADALAEEVQEEAIDEAKRRIAESLNAAICHLRQMIHELNNKKPLPEVKWSVETYQLRDHFLDAAFDEDVINAMPLDVKQIVTDCEHAKWLSEHDYETTVERVQKSVKSTLANLAGTNQ
jgi:hypothetical protein